MSKFKAETVEKNSSVYKCKSLEFESPTFSSSSLISKSKSESKPIIM